MTKKNQLNLVQINDSIFISIPGGFTGIASPFKNGYTVSTKSPIGSKGICYVGGGDFVSIEAAKKHLIQEAQRYANK